MAIGFIKKMFSFGKKEVDERPVDEQVNEQSDQISATIIADETAHLDQQIADTDPVENPVESPVENIATDAATVEVTPTVDDQAISLRAADEDVNDAEKIEIVIEQPIAIEPESVSQPVDMIEAAEPQDTQQEQEIAEESAVLLTSEPVASKPSSHKVQVAKDVVISQPQEEPEPEQPEQKLSWFERLRKGLSRSSSTLNESIGGIFTKRKLDEDTLQDLEDVLIQADLGLETAMRITDTLASGRYGKNISDDEVHTVLSSEIEKVLTPVAKPLELDLSHKPHVILVVGVNGTGKTTTIGKLAAKLTAGGLKVMLAAGDTFRAAAIEQLHIWGKRTGSPVISSKLGADAAGLAYDAWEKAKEAGSDVLIIDTAGRLQNSTELMDELAKIVRVLAKHDPDAPHTVLQTLDATTGQNALNQVEIFQNVAGVNGLVMTKLDGTARGGILVAISAKHKLPVYFIGVGEGIDDLEPFAAKDFAQAIAGVRV